MVFMDIINLDDSADETEMPVDSDSTSPNMNKNISPRLSRKRKKNEENNNNFIHELLKLKKSNRNQSNESELNLSNKLNSLLSPNNNSSARKRRCLNSNIEKLKKKRKSSVVVIDSEDDCIVVDKSLCKENKVNNNILTLSDNSVIILSDTEDVVDTNGLIETPKELKTVKKGNKQRKKKRSPEERFNSKLRYFNKRRAQWEGTSSGTNTQSRNNVIIPKQVSRQSISYQPLESSSMAVKSGHRPIIIDGSNVAFGHGGGKDRFSAKGIKICIDYFLRRNHKDIHAFVPQFRKRHPTTVGYHILDKLEEEKYMVYTPSRRVEGKLITSYDDRFIVEYATKTGGIVVTRDNYQDLLAENPKWSDTINFRLLQYTFVGDMIMFPQDPLGRGGPTLDKFLMF